MSKNITWAKYNIKFWKKKKEKTFAVSRTINTGKVHAKFQRSISKNVEVMKIYPR